MKIKNQNDVYICSSLRNRDLNVDICHYLEQHLFSVYSPGRDTLQSVSSFNLFTANCQAIINARVVVAVLDYFGKDFGFEIGFTHGLGKPIIGYATGKVEDSSLMILQAIPTVVESLDELVDAITRILGSA
ncbi:MAG: nucleoside 2-deoxyribosyltransferase [Candidatus Hodarchaeales archaeon]|jgi:nucleoside 2-deoxyribosyltransferase